MDCPKLQPVNRPGVVTGSDKTNPGVQKVEGQFDATRSSRRRARRWTKGLAARLFPSVSHKAKRWWWNTRWRKYSDTMLWKSPDLAEMRLAFETTSLQPGVSTLSIGCGSGEVEAVMAGHGANVLGVDYSSEAIERARELHPAVENRLKFQVMDVVKDRLPANSFDLLVDRGCFQSLTPSHAGSYVDNVAAAARPGAHLLLVHAFLEYRPDAGDYHPQLQALGDRLCSQFASAFTTLSMEEAGLLWMKRNGSSRPIPAVVLWMVRVTEPGS